MSSAIVASNKVTIPSPALVPRDGPMARLAEPSWRVAAVSAPAGFGKTSLLAELASAQLAGTAWLSCDAADRGPLRFWAAVVASLSARWPGVGDDLLAALEHPGPDRPDGPASLARDLADVSGPITIVIDDLHLARPSADVLAALISALPANARLALGSRIVPSFTLGRLRVAGSLLDVRTDDLRFSSQETSQLLRHHGLDLMRSDVTRLQELTEGWPAAVQLAAMSMKRRPDRGRFLDSLATTDLALADFLVSEVLDDLPEDWLEFLSATCVLDEFDVALCARMTGRDDASAVLQDLVCAGLFVMPVDGAVGWFRYHHLFGSFMRARVKSLGVRRFAELNRQASAALEDRGLVVDAMRLSISRGDTDGAALIARRSFWRDLRPADAEVTREAVHLWLQECGDAAITAEPVRLLTLLTPVIATSPTEEMASWLARVDAAHDDPSPELSAYLHINWCEYHLARGEVDEALPHRDRLMASFGGRPPADTAFALIHVVNVRAFLDAGDLDRARSAAESALSAPTGHRVVDDVRLPALRAWIAVLDGDLVLAERLAASVLQRLGEVGSSDSEPGQVWSWLVVAALHAERMEEAAAAAALGQARRLADRAALPWLRCEVALQQAALARTVGDPDAARRHLGVARALLVNPAPCVLARFDLEAARQNAWSSRAAARLPDGPGSVSIEPLSSSELSVLRYLSSRLTNREIAAALYVSINTLKTHIKSIYRKLDVASRDQAVAAAQRHHLI